MERGRSAQQENYWLIQYQKLLDTKPAGVLEAESNMDPQVSLVLGHYSYSYIYSMYGYICMYCKYEYVHLMYISFICIAD